MSEVFEGESIQAAINSSVDGEKVTVHEGTYHEVVRNNEINPATTHDHQEILERLDTLDKAYAALALEQAQLSVKLQAQEANLEDLAQVTSAQADRIERHLKE